MDPGPPSLPHPTRPAAGEQADRVARETGPPPVLGKAGREGQHLPFVRLSSVWLEATGIMSHPETATRPTSRGLRILDEPARPERLRPPAPAALPSHPSPASIACSSLPAPPHPPPTDP